MTRTNPHNDTSRREQILEVEDEDERLNRMHNMFMQLDSKGNTHAPQFSSPSFDLGDRKTFAMGPPSELLSRVQAFLPQIAASNADLEFRAREDPNSVNIENVGDGQPYIQMKLGLGVFDARGATQLPPNSNIPTVHLQGSPSSSLGSSGSNSSFDNDAEMAHDTTANVEEGDDDEDCDDDDDTDSTSSSDNDSDGSSIDIITSFTNVIRPRLIRPLPKRRLAKPPNIVVLGGGNAASPSSTTTGPS